MWDTPNEDLAPITPSRAAEGPRLGFLGAFDAAYEAQARNNSIDGLAWYFSKADEDQSIKAREAGSAYKPLYERFMPQDDDLPPGWRKPPARPYGFRAYRDIAKAIIDKDDNYTSQAIEQYDNEIRALNDKNPTLQLRTMKELFDDVRKQSKDTEHRTDLPKTLGGYVGSFLGDVVAGMDPRTSILNVATLPAGGFGRTAAQRIITQGAAQGGIEAINQFTGVQENRRLLGLDYGTRQALYGIGGAAIGGAVLQGGGEAIAAGFRRYVKPRWFVDTPDDPAPPPPVQRPPAAYGAAPVETPPPGSSLIARGAPDLAELPPAIRDLPLGRSAAGRPRIAHDLEHVRGILADWGGAKPWEIPPPTETRIPGVDPINFEYKGPLDRSTESLDSVARRVDPDAFKTYDKLAETRDRFRRWIDELTVGRDERAAAATKDIDAEIDALQKRLEKTSAKNKKAVAAELQAAVARRDEMREGITSVDSPDMQKVRRDLMRVDENMRDMAPVISRAYAHAQEKWGVYQEQKAQIDKMVAEGRSGIADIPILPERMPDEVTPPSRVVHETVEPLLQAAKQGESLPETAIRLSTESAKLADEATAQFQGSVTRILKDESEDVKITMRVDGKDIDVPLEMTIHVPNPDGEGTRQISIRQMLKEVEDDNQMLQAIQSCSLPATS